MIFPDILAIYWKSLTFSFLFLVALSVLQFLSFCGVWKRTKGWERVIEMVFILAVVLFFMVLTMYMTGLPYDPDTGTSWMP